MDVGCSEWFAQDLELAKDSTSEGAYGWLQLRFIAHSMLAHVHCDTLKKGLPAHLLNHHLGVYFATLFSSDVGVTFNRSWSFEGPLAFHCISDVDTRQCPSNGVVRCLLGRLASSLRRYLRT